MTSYSGPDYGALQDRHESRRARITRTLVLTATFTPGRQAKDLLRFKEPPFYPAVKPVARLAHLADGIDGWQETLPRVLAHRRRLDASNVA